MRRRALLLVLAAAVVAGCANLLGVEPLSGDEPLAESEAGSDAGVVSDTGATSPADAGTAPDAPAEASSCNPTWVDASAGYLPPGAINAEPLGEAGVAIYVCHTQTDAGTIPGKLLPNYGCYYNDGTVEQLSGDYQVLIPTGCVVGWRASPSGVTTLTTYPTGGVGNTLLYTCRVEQPATDVGELGHMGWSTNHECYYGLSGNALTSDGFDVLELY